MNINSKHPRIPLTVQQVIYLYEGEPHEIFSKKDSCIARRKVAELLGKKIIVFWVQIPFLLIINFSLLIIKMGELFARSLMLCKPTNVRKITWKKNFFDGVDYALLLPLLPLLKICEIFKLFVATCFHPSIHFKYPDKTSVKKQIDYYESSVFEAMKAMQGSDHFDVVKKASISELKNGILVINKSFIDDIASQLTFLKEMKEQVNLLKKEEGSHKFETFKAALMVWGERKKLNLLIRLPNTSPTANED